ncbi:hypothetical protein [Arthrobacter sp. A5]|uniref:hypothetical protein n=1 Tax=Arthrobacter sp. A5 TaxID=576926 RepID=UPI003DA9B119
MISPLLILLSALLTAVAVGLVAGFSRWTARRTLIAGIGALLAVILWRLIANALSLNEDFMPAVSVGDVGCLIAGALAPGVVAAAGRALPHQVLPALAGGLAAIVVNVIIL